jgi:aspartate 1-decarboxylase
MLQKFCRAKIVNAEITKVTLEYEGSLGIAEEILEAAGIRPYEVVYAINTNSAQRFETYVIVEPRGSGTVALYGGAARLGEPGDKLIIMSNAFMDQAEADNFRGPRVVTLGPGNRLQA